MKTTTVFYKKNGAIVCVDGMITNIAKFNQYAIDAEVVEFTVFKGSNVSSTCFKKSENEIWCSSLRMASAGYTRMVLTPKIANYTMERISITEEDGQKIIAQEVDLLMDDAEKVISWCDPKDEKDAEGRYWLAAYRGAGVYRLIAKGGKIQGAIYGGFHDCERSAKAMACSDESFRLALEKVIAEKIGDGFRLLKADGSGTFFYLRHSEDKCFLETKEYDVPSAIGGTHKNIEIV